ncbi:MAG: insulinase family protein [Oscillospiraceae bacterium]|nr:insulinase family protein [Oscillospiraceae bacterium]
MQQTGLERINIGSQIYINFVESDKFKQNYIVVNIAGRLEDGLKAAKTSVLDKVLRRGSRNYPTMAEINKRLGYLYASSVNLWSFKYGEAQILAANAQMLDNKYALDETNILDETIGVLADILMNPLIKDDSFDENYVETEKTNAVNEILSQINDKSWYAYKKCVEHMCRGERFAIDIKGEVEDVAKINGKNLYEYYRYILENCAIEIFCIGRLSNKKDYITDKFRDLFKNIKRAEKTEDYSTDVILKAVNKGEITEEMEVNQGKLVIGFRTGITNKDEDFASLVVFNSLYGSGITSKLFENVREKLSLCYYCNSGIDGVKGIMTVSCGVEVENKQKALDEIFKQLEDVKSGNFTAQEIENAKLGVINGYKKVYDNFGSIAYWYFNRLLQGEIKTPEQVIEEIEKIGRGEIINAANKLTLDTVYFLKGTILNNPESGGE